MNDLRYALRSLIKRPGFTGVAVLTLALGIGANTAMFSVVNHILIRPLPYEDSEQVVRLVPQHPQFGESDLSFSYADLRDLETQAGVLSGVAAQDSWRPVLDTPDGAERLEGASVSAAYFDVLGVRPALGRFFLRAEGEPGSARVIVLSHALWQTRFGGDSAVVGSHLLLSGAPFTVVGVAPADFEDPRLSRGARHEAPQLWLAAPRYWVQGQWADRGTRFLTAVARLAPGVTLDEAQVAASTVMRRLQIEYPESHADWDVRLVPLKERIVGPVRPALLALLTAVGLVLLIACANLANLLLARGAGRRREVAVRVALGGTRRRILRQLLTESVVLAVLGGAAGLGLLELVSDGLVALGAGQLPRLEGIRTDPVVLGFTASISVLTGILFGFAPAFQLARTDVRSSFKTGSRGATSARSQAHFRAGLVAAEVALTVVLLAGAGLLVRSLSSLYAVDPGLEPDGLLTMHVGPPFDAYSSDADIHELYARLAGELASLPGVEAAAATSILPFSGGYWQLEAETDRRTGSVEVRTAGSGLFRTARTPIVTGREFTDADRAESAPVVIVNQALVKQFFPRGDAAGRRITVLNVSRTIVGVAADVRQFTLDLPPEPVMYVPLAQSPQWLARNAYLMLRATGDPALLAPPAHATIRRIDPRIPIRELRTMEQVLGDTMAQPRFRTTLFTLVAGLAMVLALVGIYGVVTVSVEERRQEIGVRMALGASGREVLATVLRRGMRPVVLGLALGLVGAVAAGRALTGLLFGISATDLPTFLLVPVTIAATATLATWLPARRAAQVDPMEAVRYE
jgi:putative ABC transport system permease protein